MTALTLYLPPLLAADIALANCAPTPLRFEQFPALANDGALDDGELDFEVEVEVDPALELSVVVLALLGLDTLAVFVAGFLVVVVLGVLDPPQPAISTATTPATADRRKLTPPRPRRAGISRSMIPPS
jgi:hypothetical protein